MPIPSSPPSDGALLPATRFIGGRVCLDFINTVSCQKGVVTDSLASFSDLDLWMRSAEHHLGAPLMWAGDASKPAAVLKAALALRSVLDDLVRGQVDQGRAHPGDVRRLNEALSEAPVAFEVDGESPSFTLRSRAVEARGTWRAVIAQDMADLLCHGQLGLLRRCEGTQCIRVFYDTTKNHKRRWCSVEGCGSRAKAAAYYLRKTAQADTPEGVIRGTE